MRVSTIQKAFGAIIIANIIWSAASVVFKISLTNIPPFTLAFLRFAIAPILLIPWLHGHVSLTFRNRRDFWKLIAYALSGITGNIFFYFLGLQKTYAINATIIASGAPILTLLLAHAVLGENITIKKTLGFLFGAFGLALIILEPVKTSGLDSSLVGNIFLVLAVLSAVVQTIIGRNVLQRHNPIVFTFWAFVIGAASFLPLAVLEYATTPFLVSQLDWRAFMGIGYGSIFSSAIAYTLFAWGLSKISATDTSLIAHLDPIIGAILGYFILHEPITSAFISGAFLIFFGIYMAEGRFHYHPMHTLRFVPILPLEHIPENLPTPSAYEPKSIHHKKTVIASLYKKDGDDQSSE